MGKRQIPARFTTASHTACTFSASSAFALTKPACWFRMLIRPGVSLVVDLLIY
jgi:hypothetical protein